MTHQLYTRMYYTRTNRTKLNHLLNYNQSLAFMMSAMVGYEEETYDYRETNVSKLGLTDAAVNDLDAATTPYSIYGYGLICCPFGVRTCELCL